MPLHSVQFRIRVDRGKFVSPNPQPEPRQREQVVVHGGRRIETQNAPSEEFAPAQWHLTRTCLEFYDAVNELLHGQPFTLNLDIAGGRLTISVTRPISTDEASVIWGALRIYVFKKPFMVKAERAFNEWYSPIDKAWYVKIEESIEKVHELCELVKETGLVSTQNYTRWMGRSSWRGECVDVYQTGLLKFEGGYGESSWRYPLREAMGEPVELMSPDEVIESVLCEFKQLTPDQHAFFVILEASSVLALQSANEDVDGAQDVGEVEV
jgi:hypothetical protein